MAVLSRKVGAYPVLLILVAFISLPLFNLFISGEPIHTNSGNTLPFWQDSYLRQVIIFTLWQAFLSTVISLITGILVARAFYRAGNFRFRSLILGVFGLPLVIPAIVAVLGIVSVYGSEGWLPLGSDLYGLNGILLAHLFFNLPLTVRLLLPILNTIPSQHSYLAKQLGFNSFHIWKHIEWPALKEGIASVGMLVFMLCMTSFAVVLTLGGGPKSTTLEVAIYQSLRFDFDPSQAVILALIQLAISIIVAALAAKFTHLPEVEPELLNKKSIVKSNQHSFDFSIIFIASIFVIAPLLAMIIDAINSPVMLVISDSNLWISAFYSLFIGLIASSISIILGWLLLNASAEYAYQGKKRFALGLEYAGSVVYVVPPLVIGTGLFILLSKWVNVFDWTISLVIIINALIGLPFVIRTLSPAIRRNTQYYHRLCSSLNIRGWQRFKHIDFPLLRKPLGLSAALVSALAMGDLGVIALFGSPDSTTLPLLLYQRLSAYQMPQASVIAVFLLLCCLITFWALERIIGGKNA